MIVINIKDSLLHREIKSYCAREGIKLYEGVERAIWQFLSNQNDTKKTDDQ